MRCCCPCARDDTALIPSRVPIEVAVVVLEGWVVAHAEEEDEEEAEQEVGEQQEAVAQQEHVEQILLDPDHGAVCRSEAAVTLTSQ